MHSYGHTFAPRRNHLPVPPAPAEPGKWVLRVGGEGLKEVGAQGHRKGPVWVWRWAGGVVQAGSRSPE